MKREKIMSDYTFKVNLIGITELECFRDASKDELKVLVALASLDGAKTSANELAEELGLSKARVMSAITLFEESRVITKSDDEFFAEVEYEFERKKSEKTTGDAGRVSDELRQSDIRDIIVEIELLLEKTLEIREVERIVSLNKDQGLTAEFILTLAAYLKDTRQRLTVELIMREAKKLIEKNITSLEELEVYIKEKTAEVAGEWMMRNILGIHNRSIAPSERKYFKKWMHELYYSEQIIREAYDITVNATGSRSLAYMDKILSSWFESGCKTLEECRSKATMHKYENSKNANNSSQKSKKKVEADTPKYTDFNSEDALMRALERSYGADDEK